MAVNSLRRFGVLLVLVASLMVATTVHAQEEERVRAYRDIYFGMSADELDQAVRDDSNLSTTLNFSPSSFGASATIGGRRYYLSFKFFEDQLYEVVFIGPNYRASYFESAVEDTNTLAGIIEETYGPPPFLRKLSFIDIRSGYVSFSHMWFPDDIGEQKRIRIGISEHDFKYSSYMVIDYPPLVQAKEQAETAQKEQTIKEHIGDF